MADGNRQAGLDPHSGVVMGISCVTTETVLVLLAEAGPGWHAAPFHHFHLERFSTLPLLPCQALSRPQPTHLSDVSLTSPGRALIGMCVLRKPRRSPPLYSEQVRTCSGRTISEACRLGVGARCGELRGCSLLLLCN